MPGFTAEALPAIGAVRLVVDLSDDPLVDQISKVQMLRLTLPPADPQSYFTAEKVRVRPTYVPQDDYPQYGLPWEMFNRADVWYDVEAPLDVAVWYMIEMIGATESYGYASALVNMVPAAQSEFETGIAGWQADPSGAISWETAGPLDGAGSLRITATAVPGAGWTGARLTARPACVAGRVYGFEVDLLATGATNVRAGVDWYTAGDVYVSTTYAPQNTVPAGVRVARSWRAVAPATAAKVQPRVTMNTPVAIGNTVLVDGFRLFEMGQPYTDVSSSVILSSAGGGWLTDPTIPAADVRLSLLPTDGCDVDELLAGTQSGVIFAAHSAEVRAGAGARFDTVQQRLPVPVTGVRKAPTGTLTLAAVSFDDRDAVHDQLDAGTVSLLRLPPEFGIDRRWLDVADVATTALSPDLRLPYRVLDLPYAEVGPPSGTIAGVPGTRITDLDRYDTWAAFDAAGLTSIDLLHGAGSTTEVEA